MRETNRAMSDTAARDRPTSTPTDSVGTDGVIDRIVVAVPARDEWATIVDCLESLDAAVAVAGIPTRIVVAADSCRDATADVVRGYASRLRSCRPSEVAVVEGRWGGAGAARRAAVEAALRDVERAERVWIANTDADTTVPPTWLHDQLVLAERHHAVAGVVELDPATATSSLLDLFRASYRIGADRHSHVHGANFGVRADVYRAAGGWCASTVVGEDHGLWSRILAIGASTVHSTDLRVITSGRTSSRVDGGFASDLAALVRRRQHRTHEAGERHAGHGDATAEELVA